MLSWRTNAFYRVLDKMTGLDTKYIFGAGIWASAGVAASIVCSLIMTISLTHFLEQSMFGEFQLFIAIISTVSIFSLPGMRNAVVRSIARGYEGSFILATKSKINWSLLGSAALFTAAGYFYYIAASSSWTYYALAAILFPVMYGVCDWHAILTGREMFDKHAQWTIVSNVIISIGTAMVAVIGNLMLILVSFVLLTMIANVLPFFALKRTLNKRLRVSKS